MSYKTSLTALLTALSISLFAQEEMPPLEQALSGILTIGVFDLTENDLVMGFGKGKKSYAEIAYERNLDMGEVSSNGSGFVIELDGKFYVITNAHVIDAAAPQRGAICAFSIMREKYPLKVVGGDSFYDIAVLEFDGVAPGPEIQALKFSEQEVRLAQSVYAIGNPLGKYPYSITEGIISGKNRPYHRPTTGRFGFLQHTATLIWGNSGGPLVDENGQVVGINTWIETRNKNNQDYLFSQLNFALEGKIALRLIRNLISNGGRLKRAFLGVEFASTIIEHYPDGPPFINTVLEDSPAYGALKDKTGFTVTHINGEAVHTLPDVVRILENTMPGDSVSLKLKRLISTADVTVQLGELSRDRLGQIAHYFFKKYSDYELEEDPSGVAMVSAKETPRIEQFQAVGEGDSSATFKMVEGKTRYGLAGLGGMTKEGNLGLLQAKNIQELGAIIRLHTIEGHLGTQLVDGTAYAGTARLYLTDEDFNEIKVLYY